MTTSTLPPIATALALALLAAAVAGSQDMERVPAVGHAATQRECGECHMAYQPALLPAAGWRRIMAGLDDHFGDNASLAADVAADIERYLVANAGGGDPAVARITGQRWWRREHDEVSPASWRDPRVTSRGNCAACHRGAGRGYYDDD